MIASTSFSLSIWGFGYILWSAAIVAVFVWAVFRAYRRGCKAGWDQCTTELVIDANEADAAVTQHEDMVRGYVLPILQRRSATKDLPLHTLDAERLLKLLETTERNG